MTIQQRQYVRAFGVVAAVLLMLGCVALPDRPPERRESEPAALAPEVTRFLSAGGTTIFIHGAGEGTEVWAAALAAERGGVALDWAAAAAQRMRAPARGYRLGRSLAPAIAAAAGRDRGPETLTLVAHSAGAWVAQGIVDGLATGAPDGTPPAGTLHFLDPFTARSLVQPFAGARMLGRRAASVATWYTTIDPIPFTAGRVAAGDRIDVSDRLPELADPVDAHWAVIDVYASLPAGE